MSIFAVEPFGNGYIVADYTGQRGKRGAAWIGKDNAWQDSPRLVTPFDTRQAAVDKVNAESAAVAAGNS